MYVALQWIVHYLLSDPMPPNKKIPDVRVVIPKSWPWPLGFVILTQSLKLLGGQGYSHYFDDADFNGGHINDIKRYLGVANLI